MQKTSEARGSSPDSITLHMVLTSVPTLSTMPSSTVCSRIHILPESSPRKLPESWLPIGWDFKDIQIFLACVATNEHEVSSEIEIYKNYTHGETRFLLTGEREGPRAFSLRGKYPFSLKSCSESICQKTCEATLLSLSREHLLQELNTTIDLHCISRPWSTNPTLKVWVGHKTSFLTLEIFLNL